MTDTPALRPEIADFYARGRERGRLDNGQGVIEFARTQALLRRYLPPPPAVVLDVGGGTGAHAFPLAADGYAVHLSDPVPLHIEQARAIQAGRTDAPLASLGIGDARRIDCPDASAEAVLLLGPLYHLPDREERALALMEARRVLRPGGVLFAAAISRYGTLIDGVANGRFLDPDFRAIVAETLDSGRHRPTHDGSRYFTTAYLHLPDELSSDLREAGFTDVRLLAIEGPTAHVAELDRIWSDPVLKEALLAQIAAVEAEPSLLGASAHLMGIGRKT